MFIEIQYVGGRVPTSRLLRCLVSWSIKVSSLLAAHVPSHAVAKDSNCLRLECSVCVLA